MEAFSFIKTSVRIIRENRLAESLNFSRKEVKNVYQKKNFQLEPCLDFF